MSPSWEARSEAGHQVTPEPSGYLRQGRCLWTFEELKTFSASLSTWEGKIPIPASPARLLAQSWTVAMTSKGKQFALGRRRWECRVGEGGTERVRILAVLVLVAIDILGWGSSASQRREGRIGGNHFGRLLPLCLECMKVGGKKPLRLPFLLLGTLLSQIAG